MGDMYRLIVTCRTPKFSTVLLFDPPCPNHYDGTIESHRSWMTYFHQSLDNPAAAEIKVHPHEALPQGMSPHCGEGLAQLVSHFGDRIFNDADKVIRKYYIYSSILVLRVTGKAH